MLAKPQTQCNACRCDCRVAALDEQRPGARHRSRAWLLPRRGHHPVEWDADNFDVDDLDDEDNNWKVIAGYRFNPNFGVEANYVDFGEASAPATPPAAQVRRRGQGLRAVRRGTVPISMVDLYAKAGAARIDGEGRFGDVGFQDDATEFAYGAGIRLRLQNFGIHAEYEKFDTDVVGDLDLITLGATYSFGGSTY